MHDTTCFRPGIIMCIEVAAHFPDLSSYLPGLQNPRNLPEELNTKLKRITLNQTKLRANGPFYSENEFVIFKILF